MKSWSTTKPMNRNRKKRVDELIELYKLPDGDYTLARSVGPVYSYAEHWITVKNNEGKESSWHKFCLNYKPETEEYEDNGCPYCAAGIDARKVYLNNMIIRDEQYNEPKNSPPHTKTEAKAADLLGYECHIKDFNSKSWTPIKALRLPPTLVDKLKNLYNLNKVNTKSGIKNYDINHPKFGIDINIKYDSKATGVAKYDVQKEARTELTDDELGYLLQRIDVIQSEHLIETREEAAKEWEFLSKRAIFKDKDGKIIEKKQPANIPEDLEDIDSFLGNKPKKKSILSEDDMDNDLEDFDDLEDQKPAPKVIKKSPKIVEEDDFEEDSVDDIEEDEEEEKPRRLVKKSSSSVMKKKKKRV